MKRVICLTLSVLLALLILPMGIALADENIAKNGDFEILGANGIYPAGWDFKDYLNDGSTSKGAIEQDSERGNVVKITSSAENDARFVQTLTVKPNTTYKLTCYIKTENVSGGAGANIALETVMARSTALTGTNDWTKVELVGKTGPDQKELIVGFRLGGFGATCTGTAWFDEFTAEKVDSYQGSVVNFFADQSGQNNNNNGNNNNNSVTSEDLVQAKARTRMVVIMLFVYIIAPIGIYLLLANERRNDKARKYPYAKTPAQLAPSLFDTKPELPKKTDTKLHYTKKDWIFVCALTLVYGVIAVTNLGSTKAPENHWVGEVGDTITFTFDGNVRIGKIWQDSGITDKATYTLTDDSGTSTSFEEKYTDMYRWKTVDTKGMGSNGTSKVELRVTSGKVILNEIAFFDDAGNLLSVSVTDDSAAAAVDEQSFVPEYASYMTGMYFDELYHARTAYENINKLSVYEISHPPLGKLIISVGIRIFGMNPFGWRIMGALFGVAMIPLMYAFGKRMFKRSELALLAAGLFAFDFMHFTQTRIATIDVYGVFFNLCMTYFMYKFINMDLGDSLKDTLKPLALSGLFFGIGSASKWICIYTGAALAVMFFAKMIVLWVKANKINRTKYTKAELDEPAIENAKNYPKRFGKTCLWCVLFFIIVPVIIYCASYKPYWDAEWKDRAVNAKVNEMYLNGELKYGDEVPEKVLSATETVKAYLKGVWDNQTYMFNYHSGLDTTHPYQSAWYEWPLSNRPIWFYSGYNTPGEGTCGTISSFGNPAVWWVCFLGTLTLLFMFLRGRIRFNNDFAFIFICMGSTMLPWMLISRCVFIYHYFATVPLIILASVYVLKHYEDKYYYCVEPNEFMLPAKHKGVLCIKWVWLGAAVLLFGLFYPVISGVPAKTAYIDALQWLPTWTFRGIWH